MKTLNLYILKSFLITFGMAIGILTFGMVGARVAQVIDVIANGIPASVFFDFLICMLPVVLTYTVPWSVMAAVMLVFGRLSADSEITAMRACGISLLQIVSPVMLMTVLLSGFCLFLQIELGPALFGRSRSLIRDAAVNQPMAIFSPGKQIQYENTILLIEDKVGENQLRNVQMYTIDPGVPGGYAQDISAATGELRNNKENQTLTVLLYDCLTIDKRDNSRCVHKELRFDFNYGKSFNAANLDKPAKYMTAKELFARIRLTKMLPKRNIKWETELEVHLNQRIAFGLSPIAFMLLGFPLAIHTSRRETSIGLFISVVLSGIFFLLIIFCDSLVDFPHLYPQYLLWLPNIIFQILGAVMTYRVSQR